MSDPKKPKAAVPAQSKPTKPAAAPRSASADFEDRPYRETEADVKVAITLWGDTPCLFHKDDPVAQDMLSAERDRLKKTSKKNPSETKSSAGDDRFPAWTWMTYLYVDPTTGNVAIPGENIMALFRDSGSMVKGPGKATMKRISQAALVPDEYFKFEGPTGEVALSDLQAIQNLSFAQQAAAVRDFGFELFVKRAAVQTRKNLRVRPMFSQWCVTGQLTIIDSSVSADTVFDILDAGGQRIGLLDWRPGSKLSPGRFGRFTPEVRLVR